MQTVQVHTFPSDRVIEHAVQQIAPYIHTQLQAGRVFLLLSGGSAISLYAPLFQYLITTQSPLENLTLSLADERWVTKGSSDSNEQQIRETGLLNSLLPLGVNWISMLSDEKISGPEQAKKISEQFETVLQQHSKVILIAGMGEDGHTAGILPTREQSPNRQLLTESLANVVYYVIHPVDSNNPHKQRLTITPSFITKIDQVFLYTTGEKKKDALQKFIDEAVSIAACPVIALRNSKNPVELITDLSTD